MLKRSGLSKDRRLKSRKGIEQLFREGKSVTVFPFKLLYIFSKESQAFPVLFGVTVSSRNFRKAVDRNRIKRLTREAYRLNQHELQHKVRSAGGSLSLFFIYTGREKTDFPTVEKAVTQCLLKLNRIADEIHSSNT